MKKLGILGGTFDPIHIGHLRIAEIAQRQLGLDEILFIPAGKPWMKSDRDITDAEKRLEMLRLAIAGRNGFRISTIELEDNDVSYTVDTLRRIESRKMRAEVYFIIGEDSLRNLPQWKNPSELVNMCYLVVAPRQPASTLNRRRLEEQIPGLKKKLVWLDMEPVGISSSEVRQRVSEGLAVRDCVPEQVSQYIMAHNLYRNT